MSKTAGRLTLAAMFLGAWTGASVSVGAVGSNYDTFEDVLDSEGRLTAEAVETHGLDEELIGSRWSYADSTMGNLNLQNPTNCGLSAFFRPHAVLRGEDDLSEVNRRTWQRSFLCMDRLSEEVEHVEFEIPKIR